MENQLAENLQKQQAVGDVPRGNTEALKVALAKSTAAAIKAYNIEKGLAPSSPKVPLIAGTHEINGHARRDSRHEP